MLIILLFLLFVSPASSQTLGGFAQLGGVSVGGGQRAAAGIGGGGTPQYIQSANIEGTSTSVLTKAFNSNTVAANTILIFVRNSGAGTFPLGVSDSQGNFYQAPSSPLVTTSNSTDGHNIALYCASNIAGGADTVTVSWATGNNHPWIAIFEYASTTCTVESSSINNSGATTSTTASPGALNTSNVNDLVFSGISWPSSAASVASAAPSFTLRENNPSGTNNSHGATEDISGSVIGSYTASFTMTNPVLWSSLSVALVAGVGGSPGPTPPPPPPNPPPGPVFKPTTTLNALLGNNTSGSSSFVPVNDTRSGVLTQNYEPVPGNVSRVSLGNIIYPGFNGLIWISELPWFVGSCSSHFGGSGGWSVLRPEGSVGGHYCPGYVAPTSGQVHAEVNDYIARGYHGMIITWDGVFLNGTRTFAPGEAYMQLLKIDLENRCSLGTCPFYMIVLYDGSALPFSDGYAGASHTSNGSSITSSGDENTVVAKIKDDLCYLNWQYFGSPAYGHTHSVGYPMIHSFIGETGNTSGAAPSWADAWTNINTFGRDLQTNCPAFSSVYSPNPMHPNNSTAAWYFGEGSGAFSQDGLSLNVSIGPVYGAFHWENGVDSTYGVAGQTSNGAAALSSTDSFLTAALTHGADASFAAVWPGFDDWLAGWSPNAGGCAVGAGLSCLTSGRLNDRACGMTWVNSAKRIGNFYSSSNQIENVQVVTASDYDEGTEVQTGIDNCYNLTSPGISGSTISWTMSTSSGAANKQTIDHFTLWLFDNLGNAQDIADLPNPNATSMVIPTTLVPSGNWSLRVQMVGVNSILNRMSPAVTFTK